MISVSARLAAAALRRGEAETCFGDEEAVSYGTLAQRVTEIAGGLASQPDCIAIAMADGLSWMTALLAAVMAGKTIVPVPLFFSRQQIGHLLQDSQAGVVLTDPAGAALLAGEGVPTRALHHVAGRAAADRSQEARRVIYTSGTTGQPKGVLLAEPQIAAVAGSLRSAIAADHLDRHLSLLPLSMLLEQVVSVEVVVAAAAAVRFGGAAGDALLAGKAAGALALMESWLPTASLLVPRQVEALLAEARGRRSFPSSLRFVAVGGAALASALAAQARRLGLPLYEGYGLTECGSVVALNRPGDCAAGTVGRPLEGLTVSIEDGEIVVSGSSVMQGYLGQPPLPEPVWHTGDLGELDAAGRLRILGRRDDLLVTRQGRNLSPAWIEQEIGEVEGVVRALVGLDRRAEITALVECRTGCGPAMVQALSCAAERLPPYARPREWLLRPPGFFLSQGLLSPAGKPLRAAARRFFILERDTAQGCSG